MFDCTTHQYQSYDGFMLTTHECENLLALFDDSILANYMKEVTTTERLLRRGYNREATTTEKTITTGQHLMITSQIFTIEHLLQNSSTTSFSVEAEPKKKVLHTVKLKTKYW